MITRLGHVCIAAKDLHASELFYTQALRLKKAFEFRNDSGVFGFYLEAGPGTYIEVFRCERVDEGGYGPIRHICLETEDVEAVAERLRAQGVEVTEKKLGADNSWQIWCRDPAGVRIEFHQYTDQSSQRTGQDCVMR